MTDDRYARLLFLARLGAVLALVGLSFVQIESTLGSVKWLSDFAKLLVSVVSSAITISAIAGFEERQTRNSSDNFRSRMTSALHTGMVIVCIWGLLGWLASTIPSHAGRAFGTVCAMSAVPVLFAPFIAGATAMRPREAIEASVRFFFTEQGIRILLRPAVYTAFSLPLLMWIRYTRPGPAGAVATGLVVGVLSAVIYPIWGAQLWARFGKRPEVEHAPL